MNNLREVVERGWQVGFRHSFEFNDVTFYESVGLQKWSEFYVVSVNRIDEDKMASDESECEKMKKFNTLDEAIDYIESNSRVLKHQLKVSKGQKWFDTKYVKLYIDEI